MFYKSCAPLLKNVLVGLMLLPMLVNAAPSQLVIADTKGDWGPLAPYLHAARGPGYVYTSFIFDTLVWKNAQGQLVPLLAQSWHSDADQRCHHFELNPRARWHDGVAVTAQDVAFTLNYAQQNKYRFVALDTIASLNTTKHHIDICLQQPDAQFIERVAGALPILPRHIYAPVADPTHFAAPAAMIGSGPYKLVNYQRIQGIYQLVRNDNWYRGTPRYANLIIARFSPQSAAKALQRGQIDIMAIPGDLVSLFQQNGAKIIRIPSNHPYRLLFNHQQRFHNPLLRQALAQAIDRDALITLAFHGQAQPARPTYRQQGPLQGLNQYPFAIDKATAMLKNAGWRQSADGHWLDEHQQPVELRLMAIPDASDLAVVLARQLTDFGLTIHLKLLQDIALSQALRQQEFDLALLTQSHQGDIDRFRTMLTGEHNRGDHYLADTTLLNLLDQLRHQIDPTQRAQTLWQAEQRYNKDLPSFPLLNPLNYAAMRPGMQAAFTPGGIAMGIPLPYNKLDLFLTQP